MTTLDDDVSSRLQETWQTYLAAASRLGADEGSWASAGYPHYTEDGRWQFLALDALSAWRADGSYFHGNWMAGFSVGVLWLRALGARDDAAGRAATRHLAALAARSADTTTHDLGFLFYPAFALPASVHMIDDALAGPACEAARMLASRFNEPGGYLQAFGPIGDPRSAGTSTIDTMMNLPLLWWAGRRTHEPRFHDIARRHARTAARLFLRADGSTFQLNTYDPISGALLDQGTYQGAAAQSCWSRGQAWAITGFAWSYAVTGEEELRVAAERALGYFQDRVPADGLVPWDFSDTSPDAPPDASASAIAALGMLILADVDTDDERGAGHRRAGVDLLVRLGASALNADPAVQGILLHSSYSVPHGWGVDGSAGWGDFYYGLALAIACGDVSVRSAVGFDEQVAK